MKSVFLFSEGLRNVRPYLNFQLVKLRRRGMLLFRRRRQPAIKSIVYYRKWRFNNAYLVVKFELENAVWLKAANINYHDFSKPVILNLQNITADTLNFIVYGFSKKLMYEINLDKEAQFYSESFKFRITNNHSIELLQQKKIPRTLGIRTSFKSLMLQQEKISISSERIITNHTPFKPQDYL